MMYVKKYLSIIVLLGIILLASGLRLYKLGEVPGSLDWDEASLGWNAYSLLKTGTDEYGKAFPVSIRSFNDYKPPLYVYTVIPAIAFFGLNEFSVRLPSAIAGILTVVLTYFLVSQLVIARSEATWQSKEKIASPAIGRDRNDTIALLSALLLAISPWHLQFSRGAFEANLALFFFVAGAYFILKFINGKNTIWFLISGTSFVLSMYSYHSPRLVIPVFLFLILIFNFKTFLSKIKTLVPISVFILLMLYPMVRNTAHTGAVTARLGSVGTVNSLTQYASNYFSHYNFDFLFLNADGNDRHHVPDVGLLYLVEFPFLIAGGYFLIKKKQGWAKFILIWLAAAPAAAALVNDAPHAIRSLTLVVPLEIIIAYGILSIRIPLVLISLFFILNSVFYIHQYYVHFPVEYAKDWQYGYKQVVSKVLRAENNYDTIYMTNYYDQPYIYFLFYGRIDPVVKNSGYFYQAFDKYEFGRFKDDKNALYILSPGEVTGKFRIIDSVNSPSGEKLFLFATIN